jgi:hypothetical protein
VHQLEALERRTHVVFQARVSCRKFIEGRCRSLFGHQSHVDLDRLSDAIVVVKRVGREVLVRLVFVNAVFHH